MLNDKFPRIIDVERRAAKYEPVARLLRQTYGYPDWRPFLPPLDELIDCVLSQSTTDANRDRAFDNLKARFQSWEDVRDADVKDVVDAIKPAGLANQKAPRIQGILRTITEQRSTLSIDFLADLPLEEARSWLISLDGVGPKTAAIVLCFAFNREAFPVDTHIHRVSQRLGFVPETMNAEKAHELMEAIVPAKDYYAFHLNMIQHGREICHARKPECERCPLTAYCDYYQNVVSRIP